MTGGARLTLLSVKFLLKKHKKKRKERGQKMNTRRKKAVAYIIAMALILISSLFSLFSGAGKLSASEVISSLFGMMSGTAEEKIVLYVRLPRLLATLVCGGALATAGAVTQGVLANRLASPGIIGVNSGAGLAVVLATALGIMGGWRLSLIAFLGAFITVLAVSFAASKLGTSRGTLILIGVAFNAILGAFSDAIITLFPEISIARNQFRIGDFSSVTYAKLIPAAIAIIVTLLITFTLAHDLSVLSLGEDTARSLGMNTRLMRVILLMLSAVLAGGAVSICGLISFVGLIIPNAVRKAVGADNTQLLPLCAMMGGGFVALCDTLSRVLFSPYEIPVGIILALLGAPFFIVILIKRRRDGI